jgi:transposase
MAEVANQPSSRETRLEQRQRMVALHQQGWGVAAIGRELGVSRWTVRRWLQRYGAAGEAGLAYRSHRPHQEHPQTTALAVRSRIQELRRAHPGWGARLIRRQLDREGVSPLPSEVTIQHWLARWGFPLLQPRRKQPLGFRTPPATLNEICWQADFKEKGGSPISAWSPASAMPSA